MAKFDPYKNDHQSMQIGELIFENQTDKVIVYGDIDIKKTEEGLAQALKLQTVFNDIVNELQSSSLQNGDLQSTDNQGASSEGTNSQEFSSNTTDTDKGYADTSSKEVDNPFS